MKLDGLKWELPSQLKSMGFRLCRHPLKTFTGSWLDGILKGRFLNVKKPQP